LFYNLKKKPRYEPDEIVNVVAKRKLENGTMKVLEKTMQFRETEKYIKEKLKRADYYWIEVDSYK